MKRLALSLFAAAVALLPALILPRGLYAQSFPLYVSNAGDSTIEQFTAAGSGSLFTGTGSAFPYGLGSLKAHASFWCADDVPAHSGEARSSIIQ